MADPALVETHSDGLERWWLAVTKRTTANLRSTFRLEIHATSNAESDLPGLFRCSDSFIREVQEFRAEVFFASGRRPSFRAQDGSFADTAPVDEHAYHLVCRDGAGAIVGYIRANVLDLQRPSSVAQHLGAARAEETLGQLGVSGSQVLEMGRLAVSTDRRWKGVAEALVVSAHALACRLGCLILWSVAAEGDGQKHYFIRYGAVELPDSSMYVPRYSDTACVVVQDLRVVLPRVREAAQVIDQAVFGAADGAS